MSKVGLFLLVVVFLCDALPDVRHQLTDPAKAYRAHGTASSTDAHSTHAAASTASTTGHETTTETSHAATDSSTTTHDSTTTSDHTSNSTEHTTDGHGTTDEHGSGHGSGHHEFSTKNEKQAFYLLLFLIVSLTVVFEWIEHRLTHEAPLQFQSIFKALFGELTVLGFIGVFALIVTEEFTENGSSAMSILSDWIFGDPEHLIHRFHEVHFQIFFVMLAFIGVIGCYILTATRLEDQYKAFEETCRKLYAARDAEVKWSFKKRSFTYSLFFSDRSLAEHQVFRDRFVKTCKLLKPGHNVTDPHASHDAHSAHASSSHGKSSHGATPHGDAAPSETPKPDPDVPMFNFGRYRTQMVINTVVQLLHMRFFDWLFVLLAVFSFVALYDPANEIVTTVVFVSFAISILVYVGVWYRHCCWIKSQLVPVTGGISSLPSYKPNTIYTAKPTIICADDDPTCPEYRKRPIKPLKGLERLLYNIPANRHEQLFWGQNKHVLIMLGQLRTCSLLTVVEIACTISVGSRTLFAVSHFLGVVIFIVYFGTVYLIALCIQEYSFVTSIEKMKNNALVKQVLQDEENYLRQSVVEVMELLEKVLNKQAEQGQPLKPIDENDPKIKTLRRRFKDYLNVKEQGGYESLELPYSVTEALMRDTPEWSDYLVDKDYAKHINMMDLNGDDLINEDEFVRHTISYGGGGESWTKAKNTIDRIFEKYDTNNDGLGLPELKSAVDEVVKDTSQRFPSLDIIFTKMDASGDGIVKKDEFMNFVEPVLRPSTQQHGH